MAEPLKIDVAGAEAALEAANINPLDVAPARPDPFSKPVAPAAVEAPSADAPAVPATPDAPADPTVEDFGQFSDITDEALGSNEALMQMRRSLQADYTKKQMEAGPWRKLAEELGVSSPDELKTVLDSARQIQDPQNWPALHGELTQYLTNMGVPLGQAQAQASEQMATFAAPTTPGVPAAPDMTALGLDPEEADPATLALFQQVQALTQQVSSMNEGEQKRQAQQAQQEQWNAIAARITSEENVIRSQNPSYAEGDVKMIYQLMGNTGDLKGAQVQYESLRGAVLSDYITKKGSAADSAPAPVAGGAVIPQEPTPKMTPDEAHAKAMAWAAQADLQDA
jgi:hypothetical protein